MDGLSDDIDIHQVHEFAENEYVSGHFKLAMPLYKQVLELGEFEMPMDIRIDTREALAVCCYHLKRYNDAASYNRTTLGLLDTSPDYGPSHEVTIRIRYNLARALAATSKSNSRFDTKLDEAVSIYKQILSAVTADGDPGTWQQTRQSLASALFKMSRYSDAKELYEKLLPEMEAGLRKPTDSEYLRLKHEYAGVLYHLRRYQKAKKLFLQIQETVTPFSDAQRRKLVPKLSESVDRYLAACIEATNDINLGVARSVAATRRSIDRSLEPKRSARDKSSSRSRPQTPATASEPGHKSALSRSLSSETTDRAPRRPRASTLASRARSEDSRASTKSNDLTRSKVNRAPSTGSSRLGPNLTVPSSTNVQRRRSKSDQFLDQSKRLRQSGDPIARPRSAQSSLASMPISEPQSRPDANPRPTRRAAESYPGVLSSPDATAKDAQRTARPTHNDETPSIKPVELVANPQPPVVKGKSNRNKTRLSSLNKSMPGSWPEETASTNANIPRPIVPSSRRSNASGRTSNSVRTVSSRSNVTKPVTPSISQESRSAGKLFALPPRSANDTDQWFQRLRLHTHTLLRDGTPKNPGRTPVRVAILDSGLASARDGFDLPLSRESLRKIRLGHVRYKDFTGGDGSHIDSNEDMHGTWCASLLMQTAPNAELYIANVTKPGNDSPEPEYVAEAIKWAIAEQVDIISMSFGWESEKQEVNVQLERATRKGILLFAAASNYGDLVREHGTWPASKQSVYCIYSCRGSGVKSHFNPRPLVGQYNFMFPGEDVAILEARHKPVKGVQKDMGKTTERKNGTSFATPIAAGTAAMVLDLVRQELRDSQEVERRFRTVEGMSDIFLAMSGTPRDDGHYHVRPWTLLGEDKPMVSPHNANETHKWFTLMAVLKVVRRFGDYPELS